jgi:hypothetical protein
LTSLAVTAYPRPPGAPVLTLSFDWG